MANVLKIKRLRRTEASDYLKNEHGISLAPKTLAKLAVTGGGPPYQKDGPFPLYTPDGLDAFAESRLSPIVSSTAELSALKAGRST